MGGRSSGVAGVRELQEFGSCRSSGVQEFRRGAEHNGSGERPAVFGIKPSALLRVEISAILNS
jgi:hypothetical protein